MSREEFEKAYQPDPRKSPFPFLKFNEETNLYEGYSFDEREVALINAAWWGWQEQQKRIDELESKVTDLSKNLKDRELAVLVRQERIDAVEQTLVELNEASEALHHRWHIFNEQTDLSEAEGIDLAIKDIKQALKGGDE